MLIFAIKVRPLITPVLGAGGATWFLENYFHNANPTGLRHSNKQGFSTAQPMMASADEAASLS